jgi:hypothetical protein
MVEIQNREGVYDVLISTGESMMDDCDLNYRTIFLACNLGFSFLSG